MALSIVFSEYRQDGGGAGGTSFTSDAFDSTGYDYIIVAARNELAAPTLTISDNKSTTFSPLTKQTNGANMQALIAWGPLTSPGSGHTVTLTFGSNTNYRAILVWLVDTAGNTLELISGTDVTATGTSTAPDAGSLVTDAAAVAVMLLTSTGGGTYDASANGWDENLDGPGTLSSHAGFSRNEASAGTFNPAGTLSASENWIAVAAAFKEPSAPTLTQSRYRWRNDDGSETTATWAAAEDADITVAALTPQRLRVQVAASGNPAATAFKLQYRKVGDPGWQDVN